MKRRLLKNANLLMKRTSMTGSVLIASSRTLAIVLKKIQKFLVNLNMSNYSSMK
jgi:hypothetical protein